MGVIKAQQTNISLNYYIFAAFGGRLKKLVV